MGLLMNLSCAILEARVIREQQIFMSLNIFHSLYSDNIEDNTM